MCYSTPPVCYTDEFKPEPSGELPPYFMARGARLSGYDVDDEEMAEFEELQRLKERPEDMSWVDRAKLSVEKLVEKVGFFGILACASVCLSNLIF